MRNAPLVALSWVALALSASIAGAGRLEIRHDPVVCVPLDRYSPIAARGVPSEEVVSAELQFRIAPDAPWYAVRMTARGGEWTAMLPRPMPSLERFEYRVTMTSRALETTATLPSAVRVSANTAECPGSARSSLSSAIVVSVPEGAPVVPPVPPGFNPTGVVPDQTFERTGSKKAWMLLGAAAVGGLGALVASGGGTESPTPAGPDIPTFTFVRTSPEPTSVLSLNQSTLQLFVRMSHEPTQPLTFTWRFEMQMDGGTLPCVVMNDLFRGAQRPLDLVLTAPLVPTGFCGERFDVYGCRLTIELLGTLVFDMTFGFPFTFEP